MSHFWYRKNPHTAGACGHTMYCNLVKHPSRAAYVRECRLDAHGLSIR